MPDQAVAATTSSKLIPGAETRRTEGPATASHRRTEPGTPRDVVYVIASMVTGGTQTHLLQVLRLLDRGRFTPHLYCLRDAGDLIPAARALGVPVTTFGMHGNLGNARDVAGLLRMVARLRTLHPAVVHGYLLRGNFFAAVAARLARVPVTITSKRGLHAPASRAEKGAVSISNRLSNVITANSRQVVDFTREVEASGRVPIELIPSGVDTQHFDPARHLRLREPWTARAGTVIGSITTFKPKKGYQTLFAALARIRQHLPQSRLVVVGESRLTGEPAALAARLDITGSLVLLGRRNDVPRILASLDLFLLPSDSEGMSNALLEAMAMGLAVVATDVSGNAEVIEHGRSGLLVPARDPEAMARAAVRLAEDAETRSALGHAGRQRVIQNYSAPAMVRRIEALYERLLAAAPRHRGRPPVPQPSARQRLKHRGESLQPGHPSSTQPD